MKRIGSKFYLRIPCGEIQFGMKSKSVTVWFRGAAHRWIATRGRREAKVRAIREAA